MKTSLNTDFPKIHNFAVNGANTFIYYYNITGDFFTNKYDWLNQEDQIDAIIIDANSSAQDIDVIFADLYPR